jgi:glucose-1-phosphate cytidylyltransferase
VKVVLFCGGQGLRMRDPGWSLPKPLVPLGGRPLLWHVMATYARWGHTDFVLCLGHGGAAIRNAVTRDQADLFAGWNVELLDTPVHAPVGARLRAAAPLLATERTFLANYADCLTDADLPAMVDAFHGGGHVASFLCVRPASTFHVATAAADGTVTSLRPAAGSDVWINGGWFVLGAEIFEHMRPGEDLVDEPFARLIAAGRLHAHRHTGFWAPVDTQHDRLRLEALLADGQAPWERTAAPALAAAC